MNCFKLTALLVAVAASFSCAVPWLGLTYKKATYENHLSLVVKGVHPNSGCFTAGMQAEDQIIGVQGAVLSDMSQIQNAVSKGKTGQNIKLDVLREGKKISVTVKLTDRPDDISSLTGSAIGSKIAEFKANFYQNGEKKQAKPKATLLDFWATWCGPCRKTLPVLANVYNKYAGQGLEVIGISSEDLNTLNAFYNGKHKSPYPLYRDATQDMWRRYGISAVPTLMLLDQNGYIKRVWSGAPSQALVEKLVLEVMNEAK